MSKKKKDIKPLFCEVCGIEIKHPNRRFCNLHRQTQKERMDEIKTRLDKRCPTCGVQIYHNTETCWKCRPSSVKGKTLERKKPTPPPLFLRKDNEPQTNDEIRAFAHRATEKILSKIGSNQNQIKYQLREAKIAAGIAKTQMRVIPEGFGSMI